MSLLVIIKFDFSQVLVSTFTTPVVVIKEAISTNKLLHVIVISPAISLKSWIHHITIQNVNH